jgi:hypothetical protein
LIVELAKVLRYTIYYFELHLYCIVKWWHIVHCFCPPFFSLHLSSPCTSWSHIYVHDNIHLMRYDVFRPMCGGHSQNVRASLCCCMELELGTDSGSIMEHGIHFSKPYYTHTAIPLWMTFYPTVLSFCTAGSRAYGQSGSQLQP